MTAKKKAQRVGIVFIVLLLIGGIVLMYKGNDAIVLATERKEGILTAEQVKMSFDSVSGRLISCTVTEGDTVKKGARQHGYGSRHSEDEGADRADGR